ncbi:hypothetical protein COL922a_001894 [Colletotrichum nupharicola]|nr:hypothetical protein COL922a_001894 [Colletotrichum nupharicola]
MCNLKGMVAVAVLAVTVTITAAAAIRPSIQQSVETVVDIVTATTTVQPPATTSIKCDHQWCQDGASMCAYWAGVTAFLPGFDPSRGPIPGETVTNLGPCAMPTATAAQDLLPRKVENDEMLTTPAPTVAVDCSYKFCQDSTLYCMYWAGVTGWDVSLGAIPGMQRTSLGNCEAPTSTSVDESGNNLPTQTATVKAFKARGASFFQ